MGTLGAGAVFLADDGIHGRELWVTDGTESGTALLKDIHAGWDGNYVPSFVIAGNTLYFSAYDQVNKQELWKTDGTTAGTVMVKDINVGPNSSNLTNLVALGSNVFFSARDEASGYELWTSDGTETGTVMVKDIAPGVTSSQVSEMISVDGMLYFEAYDGVNGFELWKSDGTAAGTEMVKDINPGAGHSEPEKLVAMGGHVYFYAAESIAQGRELWRTDGTAAGTFLVKDINTQVGTTSLNQSSSNLRFLHAVDDKLYFTARPVVGGTQELWVSDGSEAGTMSLFNADNVHYLMVVYDTVLFAGSDAVYGQEIWTTDGTLAGTVLLKDIEPGAADSDFYSLGEGYLHENDAEPLIEISPGVALIVAYRSDIGSELWKTDGTEAGTQLIKDINLDMADAF